MDSGLQSIRKEIGINDMSGGIKWFFESKLIRFSEKRTWQEFRGVYVQKAKVSQILIDNMTILRRIYSQWSVVLNNKRSFGLEQAVGIVDMMK